MLSPLFTPLFVLGLLPAAALAAPTAEAQTYKIRGVTEPIYHLYLQAGAGTPPLSSPLSPRR